MLGYKPYLLCATVALFLLRAFNTIPITMAVSAVVINTRDTTAPMIAALASVLSGSECVQSQDSSQQLLDKGK